MQVSKGITADKLMYMMITPSVDFNQWLKRLETNEPTNQNSIKVPKVVKPTNKKTLFEANSQRLKQPHFQGCKISQNALHLSKIQLLTKVMNLSLLTDINLVVIEKFCCKKFQNKLPVEFRMGCQQTSKVFQGVRGHWAVYCNRLIVPKVL